MTWFKRHTGKQAGLIGHHASKDWRDVLTEYSITASMSRRGNCRENKQSAVSRLQGEGEARHNACSEMLFGSLMV